GKSARKSSGSGRFRTDTGGSSDPAQLGYSSPLIRITCRTGRFSVKRRVPMLQRFGKAALLGVAALAAAGSAYSQNEQFIPMNGYWVGPYAAGGSGIFGGFIDYVNMVNARDGGVNGVKLT